VLTVVNRGHTPVQRNFVVRVEAEPTDGQQAVTVGVAQRLRLEAAPRRAWTPT
jgi:hypothetical protein